MTQNSLFRIFIIAFWFLVGMSLGYTIYHYTLKPNTITVVKTRTVVKKQVVYRTKSTINKEKFIQWIYNNSFRCSFRQAEEYANIILKQPYPLLIASIIQRESSFDSTATNKVGKILVIGLMQIYCTQDHIKQLEKAGIISSIRDLYDPEVNIKAGAFILQDIIKINKGNLVKSLEMYCGGSRRYSSRVLETLGQLTLDVK